MYAPIIDYIHQNDLIKPSFTRIKKLNDKQGYISVKSSQWIPFTYNGSGVEQFCTLPIMFK